MTTPSPRLPKYCRQREKNRPDRAYVVVDGKRIQLGEHGSKDSYRRYAEALESDPESPAVELPIVAVSDPTMVRLMAEYLKFAITRYGGNKTSEVTHLRGLMKLLRKRYADDLAKDFGPKAYKLVRLDMIAANWSRTYIRDQCGRLKRMIAYGVEEELLPGDAKHRLDAVGPLRRGEHGVRETPKVKPVSVADLQATIKELTPVRADMVNLLLLTGMRPGELCQIDKEFIDMAGDVWLYRPPTHKTQHKDKSRVIPIGPKAQKLLTPYLFRSPCFPWTRDSLRKSIRRAAKRAKVPHWRSADAPTRRPRILFLADRNILADQAFNSFSAFDEDALVRIDPEIIKKKGRVPKNGSVFFTIFQTFMTGTDESGESSPNFGDYPPDFFDFIVIDECHRGGANDESNWRGILEYFSPAVQLGLTATPKRKDNADTYRYFGEPVYTYSLKEGINDGYLTPFKVRQIETTLDTYVYTSDDTIVEGQVKQGKRYEEEDFNRIIEIDEREMHRVKLFMEQIDQSQKTLVFCAKQGHALTIRDIINQLKSSTHPDYCVRVTADDGPEGERFLKTFQDNEKTIPTILTTSQKLSTGVDECVVVIAKQLTTVNSLLIMSAAIPRDSLPVRTRRIAGETLKDHGHVLGMFEAGQASDFGKREICVAEQLFHAPDLCSSYFLLG
ncbi:type I restriction enzyme EcoKI subunit R [Aeoliella mucimassa]|uniref:Type I restriction enzyme EcoKI subunit R n=1 Tax=Aeoliella mucimassa TaxID=2527972 RepID=A0A518AN96_9BACT|nr:DEAD/DEAH box helicase family protein [Aeoliella mucimassa]QDU56202.1 type I restriction enzyme EcoKI subunit R [Aeoliella mucimassa]